MGPTLAMSTVIGPSAAPSTSEQSQGADIGRAPGRASDTRAHARRPLICVLAVQRPFGTGGREGTRTTFFPTEIVFTDWASNQPCEVDRARHILHDHLNPRAGLPGIRIRLRPRQRPHVVGHGQGEPMRDHDSTRRAPEPRMTSSADRTGPPQAATRLDGHDLGPPALDDASVGRRCREVGRPFAIEAAGTHARRPGSRTRPMDVPRSRSLRSGRASPARPVGAAQLRCARGPDRTSPQLRSG